MIKSGYRSMNESSNNKASKDNALFKSSIAISFKEYCKKEGLEDEIDAYKDYLSELGDLDDIMVVTGKQSFFGKQKLEIVKSIKEIKSEFDRYGDKIYGTFELINWFGYKLIRNYHQMQRIFFINKSAVGNDAIYEVRYNLLTDKPIMRIEDNLIKDGVAVSCRSEMRRKDSTSIIFSIKLDDTSDKILKVRMRNSEETLDTKISLEVAADSVDHYRDGSFPSNSKSSVVDIKSIKDPDDAYKLISDHLKKIIKSL